MKPLTPNERMAAERGYPATLFGFTPNQVPYWHEPLLGWAMSLHNPEYFGLDPEVAAAELSCLYGCLWVRSDKMAPRFRKGTALTGQLLDASQPPAVGAVVAWWEPCMAADRFEFARVTGTGKGCLLLAHDNGGRVLRLPWPLPADWQGLRITHYVRQPVPFAGMDDE